MNYIYAGLYLVVAAVLFATALAISGHVSAETMLHTLAGTS